MIELSCTYWLYIFSRIFPTIYFDFFFVKLKRDTARLCNSVVFSPIFYFELLKVYLGIEKNLKFLTFEVTKVKSFKSCMTSMLESSTILISNPEFFEVFLNTSVIRGTVWSATNVTLSIAFVVIAKKSPNSYSFRIQLNIGLSVGENQADMWVFCCAAFALTQQKYYWLSWERVPAFEKGKQTPILSTKVQNSHLKCWKKSAKCFDWKTRQIEWNSLVCFILTIFSLIFRDFFRTIFFFEFFMTKYEYFCRWTYCHLKGKNEKFQKTRQIEWTNWKHDFFLKIWSWMILFVWNFVLRHKSNLDEDFALIHEFFTLPTLGLFYDHVAIYLLTVNSVVLAVVVEEVEPADPAAEAFFLLWNGTRKRERF